MVVGEFVITGGEPREGREGRESAERNMLTNIQNNKRITKLVRVNTEWHQALKIKAAKEGTTISRLLDYACLKFFESESKLPQVGRAALIQPRRNGQKWMEKGLKSLQ